MISENAMLYDLLKMLYIYSGKKEARQTELSKFITFGFLFWDSLAWVIIACTQLPRDIRLTLAILMHWSRIPFPKYCPIMYECTDASCNRSELARVIIACTQFPRDIRLTLASHCSRMPFPKYYPGCFARDTHRML